MVDSMNREFGFAVSKMRNSTLHTWCAWRWVRWLGWGLSLLLFGAQAQAQTEELRDAQATVTTLSATTRQTVRLPYLWDRSNSGLAGEASFELPFRLSHVPLVPYGLYIPRLGNAYEIWLNGTLLQRGGDMQRYNGPNFAKGPRHIQISPGLLQEENKLLVHIRADLGRNAGLSPLLLGPEDDTQRLFLGDFRSTSVASFVMIIVGLLIGGVALALWATQVDTTTNPGRVLRDRMYLFASLAEFCGAVSASDLIVENTPLSWPWWGTVPQLAELGWECSIVLFCVELAGWRERSEVRWLSRWLTLMLFACAATTSVALLFGYPAMLMVLDTLSDLTVLTFSAIFLRAALRNGHKQHTIVAVAVLLAVLVDLQHSYARHFSSSYPDGTFLPYASVLFGLALGTVVMMRFREVSAQFRELMANMVAIVAQKEQEIEQSYQQTEQLVREQERTAERARVLRDMHDGVGSHITSAIHQLQSGNAADGEVLKTLRDSLDQLKLTIDAISLPPGDITSLLANLRYRLEPRLKSSSIELQWDVDMLAPLARLDDERMRHLQYMVFEAIANVLQHAQASLLRIELRSTAPGGARLRVVDNGCGFAPERVHNQGLRSLHERAANMGARLRVTSAPGNTVVEIELD